MFQRADLVRHTNGTVYVILYTPADHLRLEETDEPAYAYVSHEDPHSTIWVRSQTKMEDGRFEKCGVHQSG